LADVSGTRGVRRLERRRLRRLRSLEREGRCTPHLPREPSRVGAVAATVPDISSSAGAFSPGRASAQLAKGSASRGPAYAVDESGSESVIDRVVFTVPKVGVGAYSEWRSCAEDHPVAFILVMFGMLASALLLVRELRRSL
jgi:hypothetical protein